MKEENIIQITNKLYKTTLLFPKKEPLRYKLRETADDVLANFVVWNTLYSPNSRKLAADKERKEELLLNIEKDIKVINSYFEVAKWQNWVSFFEILEIEQEYDKVKREIEEEIWNSKEDSSEEIVSEKISEEITLEKISEEDEDEEDEEEDIPSIEEINNQIEPEKQEELPSIEEVNNQIEPEKQEELPAIEEVNNQIEPEKTEELPSIKEVNDQIEPEKTEEPVLLRDPREIKKKEEHKKLNDRQEKIIDILREKGKIQVWEVSKILPDVSKRTIRRDFVQLLEDGLITRIGEKNDTFYQLKD